MRGSIWASAALACLLTFAVPATGAAAGATVEDGPSGGVGQPVLLIGATGLAWSDVTDTEAPTLSALAGSDAATGSLVVRSARATSCPADGWLTLSAGARAAETSVSGPADLANPSGAQCGTVDEPRPDAAASDGGAGSPARVAGWESYLQANAGIALGALGDALDEADVPVVALGPGAAIALADGDGAVAAYQALGDVRSQVAGALASGGVVAVDAGEVLMAPGRADRPTQVAAVDAIVAEALTGAGDVSADVDIVIASLADDGTGPGLRLLATKGWRLDGDLVGSPSTRRADLAVTPDVTSTVTSLAGAGELGGRPLTPTGAPGTDGASRASEQADLAVHAGAVKPLTAGFGAALGVLAIIVAAGACVRPSRRLAVGGIWVGALPAASFLANLAPWWRFAVPPVAVFGLTALIGGVLTAPLAWVARWNRGARGAMAAWAWLGAGTASLLTLDAIAGGRLQFASLLGMPPLVGGRFYGFSNTTFALVATGAVMACGGWLGPLADRGRRRPAAVWICLVGLALAAVDGWPAIGADFGGPPAIVPAFAVFALLAAGARVTWRRILAVLGAGLAAVVALALADFSRGPDHWSHLGAFVAAIGDGSAWQIIARKAEAGLTLALYTIPVGLVVVAAAWWCQRRLVREGLWRPLAATPLLGPAAAGLAVLWTVGALVNDSSVAIVAMGASFAVPPLAALLTSLARARDEPSSPTGAYP